MQASDSELDAAIEEFHAFDFHGVVSTLDQSLAKEVVELLMTSIRAEGMDFERISISTLVQGFESDGIPEAITKHCLSLIASRMCTADDYASGFSLFFSTVFFLLLIAVSFIPEIGASSRRMAVENFYGSLIFISE